MRILDKYILKNFLAPLIYCLILFAFLYVIIDLFGHLDEILKNGIPIIVLARYYLSMMPFVIINTTPIASMISVVYVISSMNKHDEIIAMRASGINLFRILLPFLFIGLVISFIIFTISEKILPTSSKEVQSIKENYIENRSEKSDRSIANIALYGKNDRLIFIESMDRSRNTINQVTILKQDKSGNVTKKINARKGEWVAPNWILYNVLIYELDDLGMIKGNPEFLQEKEFDMEAPKVLLSKGTNYESMSFKDLSRYIKDFSNASPATITKLKVDLHQKISFPFTTLIVMIIGASFAIKIKKRGKAGALMGVGISIIIGFLYYALMSTFIALGKSGALPPLISAHLANILFTSLGIILMRS
ncbi:MAG: LptF/LptG family permease [Candidatus Omnitrophota bacterium]